jgi:hypothetical protein
MALRFRPMQSKDVRECVEIVRAHPVLAPQYEAQLVICDPFGWSC